MLSAFLFLPIAFQSWAYNFKLVEPFKDFDYVARYVANNKDELELLAKDFRLGRFPESNLQFLPSTTDSNGNFVVDSGVFATMGFLIGMAK